MVTFVPSLCYPGRGRGRQVIAVARTADVVVMMLDATKGDVQRSVQQGTWGCHMSLYAGLILCTGLSALCLTLYHPA